MQRVTSPDGTSIAYDRVGEGDPIIFVDGATGHRAFSSFPELASLLANEFTGIWYDRRGRGDSTDTQPYAIERELEDLIALIDEVGGKAHVYAVSSGCFIALETAKRYPEKINKLVVFEPPMMIYPEGRRYPEDYVEHLQELLDQDRRDEMVAYFMTAAVGMPVEAVEGMKQSPIWPLLEGVAPTLIYDGKLSTLNPQGSDAGLRNYADLSMPTLVLASTASDWLRDTAYTLSTIMKTGQFASFPGEFHMVPSALQAPLLSAFFK